MDTGGLKSARPEAQWAQGEEASTQELPLVGASPLFQQILHIADAVATNNCVVLLEGESGTGKELVARRIHVRSPRGNAPFIPVNCPAISETLFESQFYGHVKGAFTGAASDTLGIVRAAQHGTLLLDEVGELPLHLQPKLLRLLQQREVTPVGGTKPIAVDVRFIAATNRSLAKCVADGTFRCDLYHRLNIVRIEIPPLRSRPEDIDPLLDYYIEHFADLYQMPRKHFGPTLRQCLREYPWPGNIRELCGYVERLYAADLDPTAPASAAWDDGYISHAQPQQPGKPRIPLSVPQTDCPTLAMAEAQAIRRALQCSGHNRSLAARLLEIHRTTLLRKIRQHRLDL